MSPLVAMLISGTILGSFLTSDAVFDLFIFIVIYAVAIMIRVTSYAIIPMRYIRLFVDILLVSKIWMLIFGTVIVCRGANFISWFSIIEGDIISGGFKVSKVPRSFSVWQPCI